MEAGAASYWNCRQLRIGHDSALPKEYQQVE